MKKQILLSTGLALCFSASAAELKWVKTPFWSAPQVSNFDLKLAPASPQIQDNCVRYKNLIFAQDGSLMWPDQPKRIDRYRKTVMAESAMDVQSFETFFEIETPLERGSYIEQDVHLAEDVFSEKEKLPNNVQTKSYSGAYLADIDELEFKILPGPGSLTKVSQDLELADTQMVLTKNSLGALGIKVFGRDVACDLYFGKIKLVAKAPGYVGLAKEEATKLNNFFHGKLEDELNRVLAIKEDGLTYKAARLGFQWGKLIEEEFRDMDEKLMGTRIKMLFDLAFVPKTLTPSSNIVEINKRKTFRLNTRSEGETATVNFSF